MQSLHARIDSFQKTKRVKRYPSKSSSSAASIKWPHPSGFKANANTLAEAGFFFSPSWEDRDGVTCFLCGKELSDWDADDDPFEIHYTKCQSSCAWAVVRCGLTEDLDDEGRFVFEKKTRLPSSKAMEKARLETFGKDWWPHDGEPGHGATSIKMAQAGFVYTPQAAGDDTVMCLYCNLSLGGWEKEDDPIQEHRSRGSDTGSACPFLSFSSKHTRSKARSTTSAVSSKSRRKTKATRGKSVKASQRPPSPSRTISRGRDETGILDIPTDLDVSPAGTSTPQPVARSSPLVSESHILPEIANSQLLTHHERTMSLEQWIRQEIGLSYERLLTDGRQQIELFKTKAAELRKCIDEL